MARQNKVRLLFILASLLRSFEVLQCLAFPHWHKFCNKMWGVTLKQQKKQFCFFIHHSIFTFMSLFLEELLFIPFCIFHATLKRKVWLSVLRSSLFRKKPLSRKYEWFQFLWRCAAQLRGHPWNATSERFMKCNRKHRLLKSERDLHNITDSQF